VPCIAREQRRTEHELYADVDPVLPGILGALLDAVACALKNFAAVKLPYLPRMADFAKWVTAAEPALGWKPGSFLEAYTASQDEANDVALDAYPIVDALRKLLADRTRWEGKPTELLALLTEVAGKDVTAKVEDWPKGANVLTGQLRRLAPNLRKIGMHVTSGTAGRGKTKHRSIVIGVDKPSSPATPASKAPNGVALGRLSPSDGPPLSCRQKPSLP
jgi:hypothetical protein